MTGRILRYTMDQLPITIPEGTSTEELPPAPPLPFPGQGNSAKMEGLGM